MKTKEKYTHNNKSQPKKHTKTATNQPCCNLPNLLIIFIVSVARPRRASCRCPGNSGLLGQGVNLEGAGVDGGFPGWLAGGCAGGRGVEEGLQGIHLPDSQNAPSKFAEKEWHVSHIKKTFVCLTLSTQGVPHRHSENDQ